MPSYLVLARKYRPSTFSEVVGQDHVVRTLGNSIISGRVAHAFLFSGVRGVGKTTVARILAKTLNCAQRKPTEADCCNQCPSCREIAAGISVDVQEIDGASNTSVENIREINENIKYPPVSSPLKIIIIDEVHMISINAFNALLKTLEEPPPHAKFVFATTESRKVPATINSRCQRFNFRTISQQDIIDGMVRILAQEKIEAETEALAHVAREAQGSFRDALSLLDQVIAFSPRKISTHDVREILGITGRESFPRLIAAVLDRDPGEALRIAHDLFAQGYDPEQFAMDLIHYVRNLVVARTVPHDTRPEGLIDASPGEIEEIEALAAKAAVEELQNLFSMLARAEGEIRRSASPWIALEMTVLRMACAPDIVDLTELVRRVDAATSLSPPTRAARKVVTPAAWGRESSKEPAKKQPASSARVTPLKTEPPTVDEAPAERFTITKVTPLPTGAPDEVWAQLKARVADSRHDPLIRSVMDHGNLIAFGPTEVEIGFTKRVYQTQFEDRLQSKPALKAIFEEFFGDAKLRILTLAQETSLVTAKPYSEPADGQTDLDRALRHEAQENPIVKSVLEEFQDSTIEEIRILPPKT